MFGPDGRTFGHEWETDSFDDWAVDWLKHHLDSKKTNTALDIGCAYGEKVRHLIAHRLFDVIYANDIQIRDLFIRESEQILRRTRPTVPFVVKSAVELGRSDLPGLDINGPGVDYINCRNVLHFLPPQAVRQVLSNIANTAAKGALVTLSFDNGKGLDPDSDRPAVNITEDILDFATRYRGRNTDGAPYAKYDEDGFKRYMSDLGFSLLRPNISEWTHYRADESYSHIAALAPGPSP